MDHTKHHNKSFSRNSPKLLPHQGVEQIIRSNATARRILDKGIVPKAGEMLGVRLNLNILASTGVAIQTLHRPTSLGGHRQGRGWWAGEVITYLQIVVLEDACFNVNQNARYAIATGRRAKFPMACVDGRFCGIEAEPDFSGVEIRFNPMTMHLFCDRENRAVAWAKRVTIYGHRVYAQGEVRYHTDESAPVHAAGGAPSIAQVGATLKVIALH